MTIQSIQNLLKDIDEMKDRKLRFSVSAARVKERNFIVKNGLCAIRTLNGTKWLSRDGYGHNYETVKKFFLVTL